MTLVVMQLDVVKIAGFLDPWLLIQVFEIVPKIRVFVNVTQVALEVDVIDGVEAEQGREYTPVGFGDSIATQIPLLLQNSFPVIEGVEQFRYRILVSLLTGRKSRPVDTIVDGLIDSVNRLINTFPQVLRVKVLFRLDKTVKFYI